MYMNHDAESSDSAVGGVVIRENGARTSYTGERIRHTKTTATSTVGG